MKVVLDSNVLLAALGTHGLCEALLASCLKSHEILVCEQILAEVQRHLTGKFRFPISEAAEVIESFRQVCTIVVPRSLGPDACRDPEDLAILGTALAGQADCLVTGDADLLVLEKCGNIPILSPRGFYDLVKSSRS